MSGETKTVERIPFPFAVGILVCLILIPGLFLGKWNFTTWIIFITWAEYFVFGATPAAWKRMIPSLAFGSATAALWVANWTLFESLFGTNFQSTFATWLILGATNFIWVTGLCYAIAKIKLFQDNGLACFNGLTLFLAVWFTGSFPQVFEAGTSAYVLIFFAFVWNTVMCWLGYVAGVINMWLTFPKTVKA